MNTTAMCEFTCADCGQEIEVDKSMRESMTAHGCPVCGHTITSTNFERQPTAGG